MKKMGGPTNLGPCAGGARLVKAPDTGLIPYKNNIYTTTHNVGPANVNLEERKKLLAYSRRPQIK